MISSLRPTTPQVSARPGRSVRSTDSNEPNDSVSLSRTERSPRPSFWKNNALALGFLALVGVGMGMHQVGVMIHANNPITADAATVSLERELAIGRKCSSSSRPAGTDAVQIARAQEQQETLRSHSTRPELDYSVKIVDSGVRNAYACSDGSLFVEQSLAQALDSTELLFVGAHELGHVEHRHVAERVSYLDQAGWVAHVPIMSQPFVRDFHALSQANERQADCFALDVLKKEGVDSPVETAESALRKTVGSVPQGGSHPPLVERLEALRRC